MFSVAGFSFSGAAPNQGLMFARLKDFEERRRPEQSLAAVLGRVRGPLLGGIPGALVIPVAPPAIQGLSTFGGFQFEVLDQSGRRHHQSGDRHPADRSAKANQTGQARRPVLELHRERSAAGRRHRSRPGAQPRPADARGHRRAAGAARVAVRQRLRLQQPRVSRLRAGGSAVPREPDNLRQYYARASNGQMVPLDSVVRLSRDDGAAGHQSLQSVPLDARSPARACRASARARRCRRWSRSRGETLPAGFDFAWAGQSLEEIKRGSARPAIIFALSMLLVYLVLAAQYESWVLPFIILLGVPLAVFGALSAQLLRGFANDVFCQVGLVMLIGLAAKNSILIVEFAEQLREQGRSIVDAAVEAARIRLRPILMTSFAFILGVLPLAFATGAGAGARNSVGTAVAGGMLASTFLSIIFIPVLYVIIRTLAPGKSRRHHDVTLAPATTGGAHV